MYECHNDVTQCILGLFSNSSTHAAIFHANIVWVYIHSSLFACVIQQYYAKRSSSLTNGAEESAVVTEVSLFSGAECMQEWYLGWEKCPLFRGVLMEGFH